MVYMEAYDKLLESWLALVQDDKHFHQGFFTQHAVQVFNSYIQCHLAAPDGTRNLVSARPAAPVAPAPRSHPLRIVSRRKRRASFLEGSGERPTESGAAPPARSLRVGCGRVASFLFGFQWPTCVFPGVRCVNDIFYLRAVDLKEVRSFQ